MGWRLQCITPHFSARSEARNAGLKIILNGKKTEELGNISLVIVTLKKSMQDGLKSILMYDINVLNPTNLIRLPISYFMWIYGKYTGHLNFQDSWRI